jgi:hypothetical protein
VVVVVPARAQYTDSNASAGKQQQQRQPWLYSLQ